MEFAPRCRHYSRWREAGSRTVPKTMPCADTLKFNANRRGVPRAGRRRHAVAPLVGCLLALCFAGCAELMSRWPGSGGSEAPGEVPAGTEAETRAETRASPEPAAPPDELERLPLTPEEAADVESLLARAAQATEQDHLTYPSEGSALALYDRVRILDPANDEARRGLERIVERYLELAMSAADQRRF